MAEAADCPRKIWRKLETRYASTSETAHLTIATNIANKKLQPGGNNMSYMTELDAIYDRLETMGESTSDRTKTSKLVTSIPENYSSISAALRTQVSDERSWNEVQDLMQDDYERIEQVKGAKDGRLGVEGVVYEGAVPERRVSQMWQERVCKKFCRSNTSHDKVTGESDTKKGSRERDPDHEPRSSARKASSYRV